jgi:hypothetical protein
MGETGEKRRRGRPVKDGNKRERCFKMRMTEGEYERLEKLSDYYDLPKSQVISLLIRVTPMSFLDHSKEQNS